MRIGFGLVGGVALLSLLAACGPPKKPTPTTPLALTAVEVSKGFEVPWAVNWLPDGRMMVAERDGVIKLVAADGTQTPLTGAPDAFVKGQAGRFDLAAAPDFATSNLIFMLYASGTEKANGLTLASARLEGTELKDVKVVFTASPSKDTDAHYGGRLAFLPDGTVLVSVGEGYKYMKKAQELDTDFGKIVRINRDGTVPKDNPFVGTPGARAEIYTYGHRNMQGLTVDKATGRVFAHEHGPRGGDELNLIEPAKNYGWPAITYGIDYSGLKISDKQEAPGMEQPLVYWVPSIAPSGLLIYRGDKYPGWDGDAVLGALAGEHVRRVDLDDQGKVIGQDKVLDGVGRVRDVRQGPDGFIYIAAEGESGEGHIYRLEPAK